MAVSRKETGGESGPRPDPLFLLLRVRRRWGFTTLLMALHPLLAVAHHLVKLLLLISIQRCTNLIVRSFVNVHHFCATSLLRS